VIENRLAHGNDAIMSGSNVKRLSKIAVPEFIRAYSTTVTDAENEADFCLYGLQNLPNLEELKVSWQYFTGPKLWWGSWERLRTIDFDFTYMHDIQAVDTLWPEMPGIKHARFTHTGKRWPRFTNLVGAFLSATRGLQSLAINAEIVLVFQESGIIDRINTRHSDTLERLELPAAWVCASPQLVVSCAFLFLRCFSSEVDRAIQRCVKLEHVRVHELKVQGSAVLAHKDFCLPPGLQILRCDIPDCRSLTPLMFHERLMDLCASSLRVLDLGQNDLEMFTSIKQVARCVELEEIRLGGWTCTRLEALIAVANPKTAIFTRYKPRCYCHCHWFGLRIGIEKRKGCNLDELFSKIANADVKGFTFSDLGAVTTSEVERLRRAVSGQFEVEGDCGYGRIGSARMSLKRVSK